MPKCIYFDVLMSLIWFSNDQVLYEVLQFNLLESFLLTTTVITSVTATDCIITCLRLTNFIRVISA